MNYRLLLQEDNEAVLERYELSSQRIREIVYDCEVLEPYRDYFVQTSSFITMLEDKVSLNGGLRDNLGATLEICAAWNQQMYEDILPRRYEKSYANPAYAVKKFGREYGQLLSFLYTELRGMIVYAYEYRLQDLAICNELFIEIYNLFENVEELRPEMIRQVLYYYVSDYSDCTVLYRMREQLDPDMNYATTIVMDSDLRDLRYLYQYGDYITQNEIKMAEHFNSLTQEQIEAMAFTFTDGFREGFSLAGIDLNKKSTVNIRYAIGQERMIRAAVLQFQQLGLKPILYRAAVNRINCKQQLKIGYVGTSPNRQYEYDHRMDEALYLDKAFVERKLEVLQSAYEKYGKLASQYAGPAVVETFGETPFLPQNKESCFQLSEKQQKLSVEYSTQANQIINHYIPREEYSFTIIAYPLPEIGPQYAEIFSEIVKVNTLDKKLYRDIQQHLIDELNLADWVQVTGKDGNETNMKVSMQTLKNPEKETNFENCLADVNIPVGEVFTSPKLERTEGILNVSKVYLNDLCFENLKIEFKDGMITTYTCDNFETEQQNQQYVKENILFQHLTLPIGEFAIGTNTTAYVMANQYDIVYKLPILIAEKIGPHFAVGDTCYSYSEEKRVYNPDGKEIVAKENACSQLRNVQPEKAYFNCHTDITIPYDEIAGIWSIHKDGTRIPIILDGRFVLQGTEELNRPFAAN